MATKYFLNQTGLAQLFGYINQNLQDSSNNTILIANKDSFSAKSAGPVSIDLNTYVTQGNDNFVFTSSADESNVTCAFCGNVDSLDSIQNPAENDVYMVNDTKLYGRWIEGKWEVFGIIDAFTESLVSSNISAIPAKIFNKFFVGIETIEVSSVEDLTAALQDLEEVALISINDDLSLSSTLSIPAGKEVTFDLNGNDINASSMAFSIDNSTVTISNGAVTSAANDAILVTNGGTLIIDNADITSSNRNAISVKEGATAIINGGNITSQEAGILGLKNSNIVINDGVITGIDNGPVMGNGSAAGSANDGTNMNVVMNGGTLIAHIQSTGYIACAVYVPNSGSFTMNGGQIISDGCGICMRGGTVNLNGGSITAAGESGVKGKVGDSRVVVGPYAVVYDAQSRYPAMNTLELNIAAGMILEGTDGDIDYVLEDGVEANVHDNR